nr:immunoglobulin heavy chain junction region [Macaca mulatta]MOX38057.1 immunoglobulin heavy chain junction region [Macaca mulatta]MOX38086.1 immunoglobulin heavy chain junction region [Macaca mulatta]MOX38111.1 immunoglobulin heavy chain junction region [Macaca mulatta]MOX38233.1 immunoglobulin heavy chain junction region [Macaca mulatta]
CTSTPTYYYGSDYYTAFDYW